MRTRTHTDQTHTCTHTHTHTHTHTRTHARAHTHTPVNQFVLPTTVFDEESVVSKLVNPENKDLLAMAVGAIGPYVLL